MILSVHCLYEVSTSRAAEEPISLVYQHCVLPFLLAVLAVYADNLFLVHFIIIFKQSNAPFVYIVVLPVFKQISLVKIFPLFLKSHSCASTLLLKQSLDGSKCHLTQYAICNTLLNNYVTTILVLITLSGYISILQLNCVYITQIYLRLIRTFSEDIWWYMYQMCHRHLYC